VTGYVDAQNSFGARIRTPFALYLVQDGSQWRLVQSDFDSP